MWFRDHSATGGWRSNEARVMERCGMRYVRTIHEHFDDPIPGTEHGEVEYEIRSEDW